MDPKRIAGDGYGSSATRSQSDRSSDGVMRLSVADISSGRCKRSLRSTRLLSMSRQDAVEALEDDDHPSKLPQDTLEEKLTRYMSASGNQPAAQLDDDLVPLSEVANCPDPTCPTVLLGKCIHHPPSSSGTLGHGTDTLQLPTPTKLHRCDSGNESDVHQSQLSSGNASPACSDYGGGSRADEQTALTGDPLSRTHSKDSAISQGESATSSTYTSTDLTEVATPTPTATAPPLVKVWPVQNNNTQSVYGSALGGLAGGAAATDGDLFEDSETLSDVSQLSHTGTLNRQSSEELMIAAAVVTKTNVSTLVTTAGAPICTCQTGQGVGGKNPLAATKALRKKLTESHSNSSSTSSSFSFSRDDVTLQHSLNHDTLISRPSVDSLSSMDNYFSHISSDTEVKPRSLDICSRQGSLDVFENISMISKDDSQATCAVPIQHSKTYPSLNVTTLSSNSHSVSQSAKVTSSTKPRCNTSDGTKPQSLTDTTDSLQPPVPQAGRLGSPPTSTSSTVSAGRLSLQKRRPFKERLSEKSLRLTIGRVVPEFADKSPPGAVTAPVGEDDVDKLYESYVPLSVDSSGSALSALNTPATPYLTQIRDPMSRWRAIKGIMPFMDKSRKQKFVQLAGHQGSFEASSEDTVILKKFCLIEHSAFTKLFADPLHRFIPTYHGTIHKEGLQFCQLENLLHGFTSPSVMDCKIGVRTYLEDELIKAEKSPQPRKDMYEKMVKIDPLEPTEDEHRTKAISKPRYMQWREQISSTSTLAFRIEGIKCADGSSCINFKTSKDELTIKTIMSGFTNNDPLIIKQYLSRLRELRRVLNESPFFWSHEVIGSSLLFVHDKLKAGVWMIDFGKTVPLPKDVTIQHNVGWQRGNHEDGYLTGLDNVMSLLEELLIDSLANNNGSVSISGSS